MIRSELIKLSCVKNLRRNVDKTNKFIELIYGKIKPSFTATKSSPIKNVIKGSAISVVNDAFGFSDTNVAYLYEIGLILQYANFETFMVDLVIELIKKSPGFFQKDEKYKKLESKGYRNIQEAREFYIEEFAIERSHYPGKWHEYIRRTFGPHFFQNKQQIERMEIFNLRRNSYLHANNKANSRFKRHYEIITKRNIPLNTRLSGDTHAEYVMLHNMLSDLVT